MRYFIEFAYNGKDYFGFQVQPNAISIQETLDKSLSLLLRDSIEIVGAGRTDSGVHAKQMYAHFDTEVEFDVQATIQKLNSFLPKDIAIFRIIPVHADAHARFDATSRTYEYHITTFKDVFNINGSWKVNHKLDLDLMNEACKILFEYIDFECFSKVHTDVRTFNCKITEAYWQQNENQIIFTISADRFLRNMVRAIVGTLVNVGIHKTSLEDFRNIIESKNRSKAGFSVPAHGLYLTKVKYPYI
ncbi:tRNA pseudouridine(38-40) synthase TruA [Flavobacterium urocaniciphilum]|uniref:tRNA pseudouridine synthase A n=1 Tax=Flavobacterium urocaniciphilum TaxID=1299341 RepID=A0A1H8Z703_9FLAO|nr:tRNA pseudouridine(38-40) synthase TruA [Flavobacterium urocaniciphilum]SEP60113.1 tRNA pseudouridine38-40 synthase [Flavobacterium urocaniciphilum]